jgi:hypothetical protein
LYSVGSPNLANRPGAPLDTWVTWSGNDATPATGLAATANYPLDALTFVLIRVDLNGGAGNDTVYTWFNWTNLNVEPNIDTASLTNTSANEDGLNNIRIDANGYSTSGAGTNTCLAVDEIRFGNTFADVTPHANAGSSQLPTITIQPVNAAATETYPASFSVTAVGEGTLTYQWYHNTNTLMADYTNTAFTISAAQLSDAGTYHCVITNGGGSVTSQVAILTVLPATPPGISAQPVDWTNAIGFPATFSVIATGSPPLAYQWYFNTTTPLANRTNAFLSFIIGSSNDAGGYSVIVTNKFGSITGDVAMLTVSAFGASQLPAFPGADGAARLVTGGRGGAVYHVTKLDKNFDDSSPGTLKWCLSQAGPKTIVFDVAGVFWMGRYGAESNHNNGWNAGQSRINWSGNTTIAGQTAPGPVILMGGVTKMGSANTILRNVMIASGYGMQGFHDPSDPNSPVVGDFPDSYVYDGIDISGHDLMIDHCTVLYTTDEAISCNELAYNLTIQNTVVALGQDYPQADAEIPGTFAGHGLAHIIGAGSDARISVINNFYAHMTGRLPRVGSEVGTGSFNDFRNDVYYNWDGGGSGSGPSYNNFINNFHLVGLGGYGCASRFNSNVVFHTASTDIFGGSSSTRTYVSGNFWDSNKDGDPLDYSSSDSKYINSVPLTSALDVNIGLTLSATEALTNVFTHVGNNWWNRDYDFRINNTAAINTNLPGDIGYYINERLIHEAITGTGNWIAWADDPFNNDPAEGTEWRALLALRADPVTGGAVLTRPAGWDTDQDGMPDYWEIEHGLNPGVADNNGDFDNDGYPNLDDYLNELAAWPAPKPVYFTGDKNNRYAEVFNWRVFGQQLDVTGFGTITTFSFWQPSRCDTVIISNASVIVDAAGQHAGTLRLTNNGALSITNGWLEVSSINIGAGCTLAVQPAGTLRLTGSGNITLAGGGTFTNAGTLDIINWTGTLPPGFVNTGTLLDSSVITVASVGRSGTNTLVRIQGYQGHNYQLQYRDDLTTGSWQNAGLFIGGPNASITFTNAVDAATQQRFYRVAVD